MSDPDDVSPPPEPPRKQAITALVANISVLIFCFPLGGLAGSIVAGIALARARTSPESALGLIRWAWIVFGVSLALTLAFTIWTVATT